jgi:hypothetical protein
MLLCPVKEIMTTKLSADSATPAASTEVFTNMRGGRIGLAITAGETDIYLGDKSVKAGEGLLIKAGTTYTLPVLPTARQNFYVIGGDCVLTEFFG